LTRGVIFFASHSLLLETRFLFAMTFLLGTDDPETMRSGKVTTAWKTAMAQGHCWS
jgi:hypothetical protein